MRDRQSRRAFWTTVLVALLSFSLPAGAAGAGPLAESAPRAEGRATAGAQAKLTGPISQAKGRQTVFVEFNKPAAADAFAAALAGGRVAAKQAAKNAKLEANRTTAAVVGALRSSDRRARELYRTSNALAGVAVSGDADSIRELAARADVASISVLVPKYATNASAAVLTRVLTSWQDLGLFGDGMSVGVIDTGVDYTHANFGGAGTPAAYDAIDRTDATGVFPTAKVVGGWDFAGEDYDASSADPAELNPVPDDNPLDCDGHGSHVSGTAAGFGVNADGSTFTGDYASLAAADLAAMRIGPGMAPEASIYALKVFGCPGGGAGSTNLVGIALDWTLDPNADGDFSDHLDVVNISVGADYSTPDDPENKITRNIIKHGVMPVFSAGNGGDLYDIGSEAPEALSVASSRDAYELLDAIQVTEPAGVAGLKGGQYSIALDYAGVDVTDNVVAMTDPANLDGCVPFSAADAAAVKDKFVWLEWDDNDATRRCGSVARSTNAFKAGATGALFTSQLDHFAAGITGHAVIPVFQMTGSVTAELRPALAAGTLVVRMAGDLRGVFKTYDPAIVDTPSGFTSRGTRSPGVKPDVAAPGDTIVSTAVGTGNGATSLSGTSMASPHAAGIATLIRQAHPTWTPNEVKAAVMNTANHEVYSQEGQLGPIEAPNRVGAGRIDARSALDTLVLAYDADAKAIVSVGFGVVEAGRDLVKDREIELVNKGNSTVRFNVSYQPATDMPGASYELSRSTVTLKPHGKATVRVRLRVDASALEKVADPTIEKLHLGAPRQFLADESGRVIFTPTAGATTALRVPVYAAPKPTADLRVPSELRIRGAGSAFLRLSGRGLNQGSGDERYLSLFSALELQATSPRLKSCSATVTTNCAVNDTARGGDLRYVGIASTAPSAVAAGTPGDAMLGIGIATWENWANIGANTVPFVDIDTDGDDDPDYEVVVIRDTDTDLLEAWTFALVAGFPVVDIEPVNLVYGDVDSNTFDTNVIVMPVFLEALGIDPAADSARISYFVGVDGFYEAPSDTLVDYIPDTLTFDPLKPGLWSEGADGSSLVYVAQPGTGVTIHKDPAALALDGSNKLLVLNFHNPSGQRASIVKIEN